VNVAAVLAVVVEVADAAPNENDGAAVAAGGTAEPKAGAAVTVVADPKAGTAAAVVLAVVAPKVNNPVAAATVVAGAVVEDDPKANGLTAATEAVVVVAPNVGAAVAVDAADAVPKEKSPEEGAAAFVVAAVAVAAPKVKGLASAVVLEPNEETETVVDAWPKEKDDTVEIAATVVEACVEAPKLKLGAAGSVFDVSAALEAPKEKAGVVVIATLAATVLIAGAEVTEGPPRLAAPNVNGTAAFSVVSAVVTAGLEPKLKRVEAVEAVGAVEAVAGVAGLVVEGADAAVVTLESTSVFLAMLNVGTGRPAAGAGWLLDRSKVTVADLAGGFDTTSGAVMVEEFSVTVLVVEILPRERGVEVVVVDVADTVGAEDWAAETSAEPLEGFDPKAKGKPPIPASYAGGGASNFSPRVKGKPPAVETAVTVTSSVPSSLDFA